MAEVTIRNRTRFKIDTKRFADFSKKILESDVKWRTAELSVIFIGDRSMQNLNEKWRGTPSPTDVLSFQSGEEPLKNASFFMGDIVISPRQAFNDSIEENVNFEHKINELILHSILHLMGYTHSTKKQFERMEKQRILILKRLEG